jgi:hypothetical protein
MTPPPQVTEHSDHSDHSDLRHSADGHGFRLQETVTVIGQAIASRETECDRPPPHNAEQGDQEDQDTMSEGSTTEHDGSDRAEARRRANGTHNMIASDENAAAFRAFHRRLSSSFMVLRQNTSVKVARQLSLQ